MQGSTETQSVSSALAERLIFPELVELRPSCKEPTWSSCGPYCLSRPCHGDRMRSTQQFA